MGSIESPSLSPAGRGALSRFAFGSLVTVSHIPLWDAILGSGGSFSIIVSASYGRLWQYLGSLYLPAKLLKIYHHC